MSSSLPLNLATAFLRVFAYSHLLCYPPSLLSCLERVETMDDRCGLPTMEVIYTPVTKVWHYDLTLGFSAFWNSLPFTYLPKISEAQFIFFDQWFILFSALSWSLTSLSCRSYRGGECYLPTRQNLELPGKWPFRQACGKSP